jgi:hypothetical protein
MQQITYLILFVCFYEICEDDFLYVSCLRYPKLTCKSMSNNYQVEKDELDVSCSTNEGAEEEHLVIISKKARGK